MILHPIAGALALLAVIWGLVSSRPPSTYAARCVPHNVN
jgi:hypothetical protein